LSVLTFDMIAEGFYLLRAVKNKRKEMNNLVSWIM